MNPKRKIILSCILITLINITTLLYTYLPLSVKQRIPFNLQLRLLSAALFYFFQLYLLYHVAKSSSKAIYFFPFHWMIELWRNLAYVGFCSVTQPPKLYRISSLVWMGDFFPCTYTPYILIPHSPVPLHLTLEVIIKICMYLCGSYSILNTDNSAKKHKKKLLRNSCIINYFETVQLETK